MKSKPASSSISPSVAHLNLVWILGFTLLPQVASANVALFEAVKTNSIAEVNRVLQSDRTVQIDWRDDRIKESNTHYTSLIQSVIQGNVEIARALLRKKADPNLQAYSTASWDFTGKTALMFAAELGDLTIVRLLIQSGARLDTLAKVHQPHYNTVTALTLAVDAGKTEIVNALIEKKANIHIPAIQDSGARPPVLHSVLLGNLEITRILIQAGANLNDPVYPALSDAAISGNFPMIQLLIENGADVNSKLLSFFDRTETTLSLLIQRDRPQILEKVTYLLDHGADPKLGRSLVSIHQSAGRALSPIELAATYKQLELARLLLARGSGTDNALRWLMENVHSVPDVQMVKLLMKYGSDLFASDIEGGKPLLVSTTRCWYEMTKLILDAGADVNSVGEDGQSALMKASRCYQTAMFDSESRKNHLKIVQLLLDRGADVNLKNAKGDSILIQEIRFHQGSNISDIGLLDLYLKANADVSIRDASGKTPLMIALNHKQSTGIQGFVPRLISASKNLDLQDAEGNSALMLVASAADDWTQPEEIFVNYAKLLIAKKANLNLRNQQGERALGIALRTGKQKLAAVLKKAGAKR